MQLDKIGYLRDWQKQGIKTYLDEFSLSKSFLSVAYQGSGKTIYAAACFLFSMLNNYDKLIDASFLDLQSIFIEYQLNSKFFSTCQYKDFVVIVIPNNSIAQSTINDWASLGINLSRFENKDLEEQSIDELMQSGINGVVISYQQCISGNSGYLGVNQGIWHSNPLIKFVEEGNKQGIDTHVILDECHYLSMEMESLDNDYPLDSTLSSKFWIANYHVFKKLHLMTGTPAKPRRDGESINLNEIRIPFIKYDSEGNVIPDVFFGKNQAIDELAIIKTNVLIHDIERLKMTVNDQEVSFTKEDLIWYEKNYRESNLTTDEKDRIKQVEFRYKITYSRIDIWRQLLMYGNHWLKKTKEIYNKSIGIIFTPTCDVAIKIHQTLLRDNSILSIGEKPTNIDVNYVKSSRLIEYLKDNNKQSNIDWIITCEALKEGFNYPDCKVNILIPRIEFLGMTKISQMIGRTNRYINGYPDLNATCITINFPSVIQLIELDQDGEFGILKPDDYQDEVINEWSYNLIEHSKSQQKKGVSNKPEIQIKELLMQSDFKDLANEQKILNYDIGFKQEIYQDYIRNYMKEKGENWADVVYNDEKQLEIPKESGVYIVYYTVTDEYYYVGSSHNLRKRISCKRRFRAIKWDITEEEKHKNLSAIWIEYNDYRYKEDEIKLLLNPKYDRENKLKMRIPQIKTIV